MSGYLVALGRIRLMQGRIADARDAEMRIRAVENVREVQSFPKTQTGYDPMLDSPAEADPKLLEELGLRVIVKPPKP